VSNLPDNIYSRLGDDDMYLKTINIKNYRLLNDVEIELDTATTIIVGQNNTGKTSMMNLINKVTRGDKLTFHDYPISCRDGFYKATASCLDNKLSYSDFTKNVLCPSIKFIVRYDLEEPSQPLGTLVPFIIDTDIDTTTAIVLAEYRFSISEEDFKECFSTEQNEYESNEEISYEFIQKTIKKRFPDFFDLIIEAVNPNDVSDKQSKTRNELSELFPIYFIRAERGMDESEQANKNPLSPILSRLFKNDIEDMYPEVQDETQKLRRLVEKTNEGIEKETNILLADIVQKSIDFGYPNAEEMQFKAITQITLEEQIKDHTDLAYVEQGLDEELPSTYNGLGYKNLIKIVFALAEFSKQIANNIEIAVPLLFLEEPESHMHPQLQQTFVKFLTKVLNKISTKTIQVLLTTHSSHIANAVFFNQIRYVQKQKNRVLLKDIGEFYATNKDNADFIHKYLTINRCDLFFADKVILIEGTAERLLIPDMIRKCGEAGLYKSKVPQLPSQYYSLVEVGGAYAHKFYPFLEFLGIPSLIITDIDSVGDDLKKTHVSKGKKSSNATINWWVRCALSLKEDDEIPLDTITTLEDAKKTNEICRIEYQTPENGLCGRSLEEAIINANRALYGVSANPKEDDINFSNAKKTDFALDLLFEKPSYEVPAYIKSGLCWLDRQKALGN
jgi:predicted ATP-dependent endonuclease of OLD family